MIEMEKLHSPRCSLILSLEEILPLRVFMTFFFPSCSESCLFPATSSTWLNREGTAEGLNLVPVTHWGFTPLYRTVQRREVKQNEVSPKGEVTNKIQNSKLSLYRVSTAEL